MTGFNHGLTGAVIALTVRQPEIAVPFAFLSHFAQDAIPHWDYSTRGKEENLLNRRFNLFLIADFVLSVGLMVLLGIHFPGQRWLIWGCMTAAASPDLMWAYYRLYIQRIKKQKPRLNKFAHLHDRLQWSSSGKGAVVEAAWAIVFGLVIAELW